jgi:hypothetical protein
MVSMEKVFKFLGHWALTSSMTFELIFGPLFSISLSSNVPVFYEKAKMWKWVRKEYQ